MRPPDTEPAVIPEASSAIADEAKSGLKVRLPGGHSRRAWLLLGERVFSHPRYAILIVIALGLCAFERYLWVMVPLAVFFTVEWFLRLWLQRENGWKNRSELAFLLLDGIATLSLFIAMLFPSSLLSQGLYLRLARLLRGMYLLRMLRIFRFLTHDTFVYSLPFALLVVALAGVGLAVESIALYVGIVLLLEVLCRGIALVKVLPDGGRRRAELSFLPLDAFASMALLGLIPGLSAFWLLLRLARFLIMLNPVANIANAVRKVAGMQEVRSETSMLMGMLIALLVVGSMSVVYLYPEMDINSDESINLADYTPFQIILFVFRIIMDPGSAPPTAYSPWLVGLTVFLVMAGVFFFALVVGLGANVMHYLLRELSNSPLSAREHLLFVGGNAQAIAILRHLNHLCVRMRRSFPSVWIFFGEPLAQARTVGRWLTVRQVSSGDRGLVERFHLSGINQLFFFHPAAGEEKQQDVIDMHHLKREAGGDGLIIADAALPLPLQTLYRESLNMRLLDSASVAARMLYQMHHCAYMPELGIRLLDVVEGETGLFALHWPFDIKPVGGAAMITHANKQLELEAWLTLCFTQGVNLLAAINDDGEPVLFSDLMRLQEAQSFSDVIAIGNTTSRWSGMMTQALKGGVAEHENRLKAFTWPESWDLSLIFLGWHQGLPAMVEEMALKHHKLTVHVFSTGDEEGLMFANRQLHDVAERAENCELNASVHAWDGMDADALVEHLRGCKVIMFYPEENHSGSEDSMLELWYHEVARMLTARKARAKWWTPPKLMVLPRQGGHVAGFVAAATGYANLETHVGSPDAFHDVFMARRLLNEACRHFDATTSEQHEKVFRFVDAMLGDMVLVESVETGRLLDDGRNEADLDWQAVYRESLRRGWLLMGYLTPQLEYNSWSAFKALDTAFPSARNNHSQAMHLLGGVSVVEMDMPLESEKLMFCRRGVLNQTGLRAEASAEKAAKETLQASIQAAPDGLESKPQSQPEEDIEMPEVVKQGTEEIAEEVAEEIKHDGEEDVEACDIAEIENVLEGEVMADSVWPKVADKRLIRVLEKQVEGSIQLLDESAEDGLIKLTEVLDLGLGSEVEELIMAALTDLQNIDRVSQRMNNVKSCLQDWGNAVPAESAGLTWKETVEKRYVMEEERMVLKEEL